MPWLDYVLLGIILLSALISLARGFVREAFSLAIWIFAFWISWSFFRELQIHFQPWVDSPTIRLGIAFIALMVATLIIGGMVNYLIIQLIEHTGMSGTDRFIGMVFGLARGALLNAILVLLAGLTSLPQETWWQASQLIPYFQELALWLKSLLPDDLAGYFQYAGSSFDAWRFS